MFGRKAKRTFLATILGLATITLATGQYAYQAPAELEYQSGNAWYSLSQREKTAYVSGVLVGCKYLSFLYDRQEDPAVLVDTYLDDLCGVSNITIVNAVDHLYTIDRLWQVPIIVIVFNYKRYLEELGYGK